MSWSATFKESWNGGTSWVFIVTYACDDGRSQDRQYTVPVISDGIVQGIVSSEIAAFEAADSAPLLTLQLGASIDLQVQPSPPVMSPPGNVTV